MIFGERLRALRSEKKFTLRELAKELDISFSALGKYERNEHQPDFDTLEKIADYFDVSIDYLLGRTEENFSYITEARGIDAIIELNDQLHFIEFKLKNSDNLTFKGEPLTEEDRFALLEAMEFGVRLIEKKKQLKENNEET